MTTRSRDLTLLELPDPAALARFVYGHYVADEADAEPLTLGRDPARWVELTAPAPNGISFVKTSGSVLPALSEADFSSGDFSVVSVDTVDFPSSYVSAVSGALHVVALGSVRTEESRSRAARDLAVVVSGSVKRVGDALARLELLGRSVRDSLSEAGEATVSLRVNSRLIGDLVAAVGSNVMSPQASPAAAVASTAIEAQERAIAMGWKQSRPTVDVGELEIGSAAPPSVSHVGFAVWRTARTSGALALAAIVRAPVLSWRDAAVAYGREYAYEVRALYKLRVPVVTSDGLAASLTLNVQSNPARASVLCVESEPPPPPTDVRLDCAQPGRALLSWSPPVDRARDTVQYQVFKRSSIADPFTLLAVHDFSDASVSGPERVPPEAIVRTRVTAYLDTRASVGDIYAVCSVDARGLSSRYSSQLKIAQRNGRLLAERVCPAGCPKALPNLLLPSDPFPDVVYDSGKSTLVLSFAPQAYSCVGVGGTARPVVSAAETYVAQLVSLDALKSRTVSVSIKDERSR